jgi:pimeloyl-ACP methyl ester carboxylesterase
MRVVLLHALPFDERMWKPQLPALRGYEVVTPRLYGRGPSIEGWTRSLLEELDGPLVLIGASMGGYCALEMAREAPERMRGVALVGSRAGADSPERRAQRDEVIEKLRTEGQEAVWPEQDPQDPAELVDAVEALRDRRDASDVAASLEVPLLVCVGTADELTSADEARSIAESAPRGRLEVFEGAGHIIGLDQPKRLGDVLARFVEECA